MTHEVVKKRKLRANGHLVTIRGKPYFRVRIADRRPAIPLACSKNEIDDRVKILRGIVKRVRNAGKADLLEAWLQQAGEAQTPRDLEAVLTVVDDVCTSRTQLAPLLHASMMYAELFELWQSGVLFKMYPDHVKPLKESTRKHYCSFYEKYVKPIIGHLPIGGITMDHGFQVLASVEGPPGCALRYNVATTMMRPINIAVFPGRVLAQSPFPRGFRPKQGEGRVKAMMFPKEEGAYLGCEAIPMVERLMMGLLSREGMRVSELTNARVGALDLETGWFSLDRNKTGRPRGWVLRSDCAEALRRYLAHYRRDPGAEDYLLVQGEECRNAGKRLISFASGIRLREHAKTAGLTRPQLWEESDVRRHLTVHDQRAMFITISLAEGKSEVFITDRTGHSSSDMVYRYKRAARAYAEANLGPLLPLHECIPELRALGPSIQVEVVGRADPGGCKQGGVERGEDTPPERADEAGATREWTPDWTPNQNEGKMVKGNGDVNSSGCASSVRRRLTVGNSAAPTPYRAVIDQGARVVAIRGEPDGVLDSHHLYGD